MRPCQLIFISFALLFISHSLAQTTTVVTMNTSACLTCTLDSLSFVNPTSNATRCSKKTIDNNGYSYYPYYQSCSRLLFSCLFGDITVIDFNANTYGLNSTGLMNNYYPVEIDCNSNGQWVYEGYYNVSGLYCSDCGAACSATTISTNSYYYIDDEYVNAVEMTRTVINGCNYQLVGCTNIGVNYTITYDDGSNFTGIFSTNLQLTCGSGNNWYDTQVNKSVVQFDCAIPACQLCSPITQTMLNQSLPGFADSYLGFYYTNNYGVSACLTGVVYCNDYYYYGSNMSLIADGFLLSSGSYVPVVCDNNQQWQVNVPVFQTSNGFSQFSCVVADEISGCTNCSDITVSPSSIAGMIDGQTVIIYGSDANNCRTATFGCLSALPSISSQVSIIADGNILMTGIGVASVQLTCNNDSSTWSVNFSPQPVKYKQIQCVFASNNQSTCTDCTKLTESIVASGMSTFGCQTAQIMCTPSSTNLVTIMESTDDLLASMQNETTNNMMNSSIATLFCNNHQWFMQSDSSVPFDYTTSCMM